MSSEGVVNNILNGFILSVLLILSGCQDSGYSDFKGNALLLQDDRNSWVVVNYWANWCRSCREEISELNALHAASSGIQVWGVDFDGSTDQNELAGKVEKMAIAFPVLSQESVAALELKPPPILPSFYILDNKGKLRKRLIGSRTHAELEAAVAEL